jgi:hypothetical protein
VHRLLGENKVIVNFEFPLAKMASALAVLSTMVDVSKGLHLYETTDATGITDSGIQVKGLGHTYARADQWNAFCIMFNQDCVALSKDGVHGITCGPRADKWPFNGEYFKATL